MLVRDDVEADAKIDLAGLLADDDFPLAVVFQIDAIGTDADATIVTTHAEQARVCVGLDAAAIHQRGGLALIAHRLLGEHVAGVLQVG